MKTKKHFSASMLLSLFLVLTLVEPTLAQVITQPPQIAWGRYFDDNQPGFDWSKEDLGERIYSYQNNIYIIGRTKSDTDAFVNCSGPAASGFGDAFVASYNPACQTYNWIRYFGGPSSTDYAYSAALDKVGNQTWIYIAGEINLNGKNATSLTAQSCVSSGCNSVFQTTPKNKWDGFIAKYNAVTGQLVRWTYVGGKNRDQILGLAVDTVTHNVYFTGYTESPAWINYSTWNFTPYKSDLTGTGDMFFGCLDSCLSSLKYFSYYGGDNSDRGHDLEIFYKDTSRYLVLSGTTQSATGIVPAGGNFYDNTYGGVTDGKTPDAFLLLWNVKKLSQAPDWSTYFGGSNSDRGRGISITSNNDIYWVGQTQSTPDGSGKFTPTPDAYQSQKNAGIDCYLAKFHINSFSPMNVSLSLFTYFGGDNDDFAKSVRAFHSGNSSDGRDTVAIAGLTYSADLPSKDSTSFFLSKGINGNGNEKKRDAFIAVLTKDPANTALRQKLSSFTYLGGENDETDIKQNDVLVQKSYNPGLDLGPNGSLFIIYSTKGTKTKKDGNIPVEYSAFHCPPEGCNNQSNVQPDAYFAQVYPFTQHFVPQQCEIHREESELAISDGIRFYPVPFSEKTNLSIHADHEKTGAVDFYDLLGKNILHQNLSISPGDNIFTIDLTGHSPGFYIGRISLDGKVFTVKLAKE